MPTDSQIPQTQKRKMAYCLLSNDVETTSIWHNTLRDKTGVKVYEEGMPALLDLYAKHDIKTTFFFTGYIAKLIPDVVKMVLEGGHEVGSHGMSHLKENGFDVMPFKKQVEHLRDSKHLLEDISGHEVISFRAPALRVNADTAKALIETGYKIDSSVASQRFDMFLSFGGLKKLNWLTAPRQPYYVSEANLFNKGKSDLIEVPLSAMMLPYVGTTMRIMPTLTAAQRSILAAESKRTGKPIVFIVHPNEFIDESDEERKIQNRSSNPVSYFLQDYVRSNLKVKNLGKPGLEIYDREISAFKKKDFRFVTIKNYVEELNLSK